MFRFHETTRRRICRWAFFALCAIPTAATAAWVAWFHLPGTMASRQAAVARSFRAKASLADWRAPKPGMVRISGAQLTDRASLAELLKATKLETRMVREVRATTIERLETEARNLADVSERIEEILSNERAPRHELAIKELAIKLGEGKKEFVLTDVLVKVEPLESAHDDGGYAIRATARAAINAQQREAVKISIEPLNSEAGKATPRAWKITINSGAAPIPTEAIGGVLVGFRGLGSTAAFAGTLRLEVEQNELSAADAKGKLNDVDLATFLPSGSPHRVRGVATVELEELTWRHRELTQIVGAVRIDGGEASHSLLAAAVKHLYCVAGQRVSADAAAGSQMAPIDQAAARFVFDSKGLTLWGMCPATARGDSGCVAVSEGAMLLGQPPWVELPPGSWLQFVAGPAASYLPATREAVSVAERLPLPRSQSGPEK